MNKRGFEPLIGFKSVWTLIALHGSLWHSPAVQAQQAPEPLSSAPTTATASKILPTAIPNDTLSGDPLLEAKVTLIRRAVRVDETLRELSKQTRVALAAGGNEAPSWQVAIVVKDEPLRDVLRALAALNGCHWKRVKAANGREVLTLMDASDDPRYWDFLRPKTQAEADMRRGFEEFQQQTSSLPLDVQQALATDHEGVSYTSLPPEMQQNIIKAVQAEQEKRAKENAPSHISTETLGTARICLKSSDQEGLTNYTLNVIGQDHSNMMIVVGIPDDPSARDETIRPPDFYPWHDNQQQAIAAWFNTSHAQAAQDDPRLSQPVSIKTEDTSIGFPLVALAQAAHVNIIAQALRPTHTVSLGPIPLKDALDQITARYHAAWAEAPDGTILVGYHASDNGDAQKTAAR